MTTPPSSSVEQGALASTPVDDVVTRHDCPDCRCVQRAEVAAFAAQMFRDDGLRSPTGNCWDVEDGMDGFFIHKDDCPQVGHGWTGGHGCIGLRKWRGDHQPWMQRAAGGVS